MLRWMDTLEGSLFVILSRMLMSLDRCFSVSIWYTQVQLTESKQKNITIHSHFWIHYLLEIEETDHGRKTMALALAILMALAVQWLWHWYWSRRPLRVTDSLPVGWCWKIFSTPKTWGFNLKSLDDEVQVFNIKGRHSEKLESIQGQGHGHSDMGSN